MGFRIALDRDFLLAQIMTMKAANIADLKNNLSKYLSLVEQGETVEICKRNIPIAQLVPLGPRVRPNKTRLGSGKGSVAIKGDLTEPLIPPEDWDMLKP